MSIRPRHAIATLAAVAATGAVFAHTDDPKQTSKARKYQGEGWRASGGLATPHGFASDGVQLEAWLPIDDFAGNHDNANDCWGYTSPSGREYAILGLECGNAVVEVSDPANPVILQMIAGPCSLWGDVKVYGNYAYATTEDSAVGIQVIDLSDVDNGNVALAGQVDAGNGTGSSHNVVLDTTSGFVYRVGGVFNGMGVYDLNQNPINPPLVGSWSDRYIHDMQVVTLGAGPGARQIAYACTGDNGGWENAGLEILDVTVKNNIETVGSRLRYSNATYSHQLWLSDDGRYVYLNDELDGRAETRIFDVSDLENVVELTPFQHSTEAVDHNLYVRGDYIFESNYTSGLRVFDATDPEAPVEVAWFDTYPDSDIADFLGLWSNYPFFASGTVIGSDRNRGLFIWTVDVLEEQCPSDLDGSGVVDFGDINRILARWGQAGGPEDLDGSGTVDFGDINVILADWGDVCD